MKHPNPTLKPDTPLRWLAWMLEDETKRQKGYSKCRKATDRRVGRMHICGALACITVMELQALGYDKITIPMIRDHAKHEVDHPILKRMVEDGYLTQGKIAGNKLIFALTVIGTEQAEIVRSDLADMLVRFRVAEVIGKESA